MNNESSNRPRRRRPLLDLRHRHQIEKDITHNRKPETKALLDNKNNIQTNIPKQITQSKEDLGDKTMNPLIHTVNPKAINLMNGPKMRYTSKFISGLSGFNHLSVMERAVSKNKLRFTSGLRNY